MKSDLFDTISQEVEDYDVIVIGHLKWNRYFDESQDDPPRGDPSTCTSTLIVGKEGKVPFRLLVDPTIRLTKEDYYFDLNRRTGLQPSDVTHCFISHTHFDHQMGVNYFPNAKWLAATPVAKALLGSEYIDGSKVIAVGKEFLPGVVAVPLPGHTQALHGVAFLHNQKRIVVAADAVMTKQHYAHNTAEYTNDMETVAKTIKGLKRATDIVIPGHDNVIIN
jgi:glyoxylase-like metal-dependent hydrolase (beta-lactamase superfamily II)